MLVWETQGQGRENGGEPRREAVTAGGPFLCTAPGSCSEGMPTLKGQEGTQGHTADPNCPLSLQPTRGGG